MLLERRSSELKNAANGLLLDEPFSERVTVKARRSWLVNSHIRWGGSEQLLLQAVFHYSSMLSEVFS